MDEEKKIDLSQFREKFAREAKARLGRLNGGLIYLEKNPGTENSRRHPPRSAHAEGTARMLGFSTEQGTKEVERWKETIRLSSEAFSEIIATIEQTSEASTQISLATHQQTSANEQVVQAMRQIEEMVRVTASKMKESSASASRLREMAGTLQEKTAVFHV